MREEGGRKESRATMERIEIAISKSAGDNRGINWTNRSERDRHAAHLHRMQYTGTGCAVSGRDNVFGFALANLRYTTTCYVSDVERSSEIRTTGAREVVSLNFQCPA